MMDGILMDKTAKPDNTLLSEALGQTYRYFTELLTMTKVYKAEWSFSKSVGWFQKISDKKKALLYIIIFNGTFLVRMTIRAGEKELLRENLAVRFAHDALENSKKYSEGFLMEFLVSNEQSYWECQTFITEIIKLR